MLRWCSAVRRPNQPNGDQTHTTQPSHTHNSKHVPHRHTEGKRGTRGREEKAIPHPSHRYACVVCRWHGSGSGTSSVPLHPLQSIVRVLIKNMFHFPLLPFSCPSELAPFTHRPADRQHRSVHTHNGPSIAAPMTCTAPTTMHLPISPLFSSSVSSLPL